MPPKRFDIEAITAVKNGNVCELLEINKKLLAFLREQLFPPQQIVKICLNYAFSILVCYKEYHADLYEQVQSSGLLDRLKKGNTLRELAGCLDELAEIYLSRPKNDRGVNSVLVRNVVHMIDDAYGERLSLEDIAANMNVPANT